MQTFAPDAQVSRTIPFVKDGMAFTPLSATYKVINSAGDELVGDTPISLSSGSTEATIVVPAGQNAIASGNRALRVIAITCQTAEGTVVVNDSYLLVNADGLQIPSESFVGYWRALEIAGARLDTATYLAASQADQLAALIRAREVLCSLRYRYFNDQQERLTPRAIIGNLTYITHDQFASLPTDFMDALVNASVFEANQQLKSAKDGMTDQLTRLQELGVMSHKVGESSFTFGPGGARFRPVVHPATKQILGRYIDQSIRVGRA